MTRLPVHGTPFQLAADEGAESPHHVFVQGKVLQIDIRRESEAERRRRVESQRATAAAVGGLLGALTGVGSLASAAANATEDSPPRTTISVIVEVQVLDKRTGKVISEMARGHEKDAEIPGDPQYFVDAMVLQATELAADAVYKRLAREAGIADSVITQNTTSSESAGDLLALFKAGNTSGQSAGCDGGRRDDCVTASDKETVSVVAKAGEVQSQPKKELKEAPGGSTQNIAGLWINDQSCHVSIFENEAGDLVGAAWGPHGGSMQIVLSPMMGNERRFDWKGEGRTMFEASLTDPRRNGRFTINTYDENKLHSSVNICSKKPSAGISAFYRASSFSSYRVKPPKWYAASQ